MIQVLGLRDWVKDGRPMKRETFFNKGWRFNKIEDVFNKEKVDALLKDVPPEEHFNLYFTVADCFEESGRKLKEQWVIPFDIDDLRIGDDPLKAADAAGRVAAEAIGVPYEDLGVVFSGNGVQFFVLLYAPIADENFFDAARPQYGVICKRIQTLLTERGVQGKVDVSVWSKARLMRLPNTINRKPNRTERRAQILNGSIKPQHFDLFAVSGVKRVDQPDNLPDVVLKNYPKPDTQAVLEGCLFLKHCAANPADVSEPQWYADLGVRARLDNGRDLCHESSSGHPNYSHYETETKIEQALAASGPRTCKSIDQLWNGCQGCEHYGKVTSPIMIKGDNYAASRDFGFRTRKISKDGDVVPGGPAYADLIREFAMEYNYKTVEDGDQVVVYTGTHWKFLSDRVIRGWCASKVDPEPNTTELNEFLGRLKAYNITNLASLHAKRDGYLNFSNCILNINTGEMLPHSPDFGFFDVRTFAYDPHAKAPTFRKFLMEICEDDEEVTDLLEEYIGYCISGDACWLQKALVMVGDGANGKSVLMETMGQLVGEDSHAAIPIQDLEKDTLRHYLVNKLFNYSEETSIRALSDSSLFKTLVSGGLMTVKQLYVQPYIIKNRAKLVLSANNMPASQDRSDGLLRRLIIVPMNATFKPGDGKHDAFIGDKLREELPGICNRVMEAYRRTKERGFLHEPDKVKASMYEYIQGSDPVAYFYANHVIEEEDSIVSVRDMYDAFTQICEINNMKPVSIIAFSRMFKKVSGHQSEQQKKDSDNRKVYKGIRIERGF